MLFFRAQREAFSHSLFTCKPHIYYSRSMPQIIEEVTQLFPVEVDQVHVPHSAEEVSAILKNSKGKVSI
jgi:hypothetical protein